MLRRLAAGVLAAGAVLGSFQLLPSEAATITSHRRPRLIWHSEFNGPAGTLPRANKWRVIVGAGSNQELEYYPGGRGNISLNGRGDLAITARRQNYPAGNETWRYTSAKLDTLDRFQVRYGKVQARIKFPTGAGLWPAFFMLGSDYPRVGWPDSGELDLMEFQGQRPTRLVGTVHGPTAQNTNWQVNSFAYANRPFSSRFHVYGMDWAPDKVVFTVDGRRYGSVTPNRLKQGDQWVFNRPFFLLLGMAVGGYWVGPPSGSTRFPATMLVDWVRVYS